MISFTGLGYLTLVFFIAPFMVIGVILERSVGFDVLSATSRWPLHSLMILGAVLTFVLGRYFNRRMVEETIYEKTGPVKVFRPRHTLYWIRMEYWGPIFLVFYFAIIAFRPR